MDGMVAALIAALAFAHGAAPAYTIHLERLLAPTVNGHPIAAQRDATRIFGTPSHRSGCTADWSKLALEVNTCGIGVELTTTASAFHTKSGLHPGDAAARAQRAGAASSRRAGRRSGRPRRCGSAPGTR